MPKFYPSFSKATDVELDKLRNLTDDTIYTVSTEQFRLSRVNLEEYRHNKGQIIHFVYIELPTLDSRCFQRTLKIYPRQNQANSPAWACVYSNVDVFSLGGYNWWFWFTN